MTCATSPNSNQSVCAAPRSKTTSYRRWRCGPLWAAIARMGAGGPQLQDLIQQHFDPWSTVRGFDNTQLGTALDPILKRLAMEQGTQSQAFTSGGG